MDKEHILGRNNNTYLLYLSAVKLYFPFSPLTSFDSNMVQKCCPKIYDTKSLLHLICGESSRVNGKGLRVCGEILRAAAYENGSRNVFQCRITNTVVKKFLTQKPPKFSYSSFPQF